MKIGGIDIGSRYIKYVLLEGTRLIDFQRRETGYNPLSVCGELLEGSKPEKLVATGYGRYLLEVFENTETITEIKAVARGAKAVFPKTRTIIDIGGQDTKVISLNDKGAVLHFEMNDRCAAGTGKFLEIMARTLGYDLEVFGKYCHEKIAGIKINSLCTVFAESEVIGLITKGEKREAITHALHDSIVSRVMSLIKRVDIQDDVIFTGGCAKNSCLKRMFEERLQRKVYVHDNPYLQAAHGAALHAMDSSYKQ